MLVNPKGDVYAGMFEDNQYNGIGVMEFYLGARYARVGQPCALLLWMEWQLHSCPSCACCA